MIILVDIFCHEFCHGIAESQINTGVMADGSMSSSLSLAIPQNPRKHGVFGGFLMLMTNSMTNVFCGLQTPYVTLFVMNFVMKNRKNRWRDIDSPPLLLNQN